MKCLKRTLGRPKKRSAPGKERINVNGLSWCLSESKQVHNVV
jgi:hypothetical protein